MNGRHQVRSATDAVVVVDVQRDFCPGGTLAVPRGDEVVPVLARWLALEDVFKVLTRDWHPPHHSSFKAQGGQWAPHCVRETPGAAFHPNLPVERADKIVSKAVRADADAYSAFEGTDLGGELHLRGVRRLWVGGLATEYCVKATVLDAIKLGLSVCVIADGIRGIETRPGDCDRARQEMEQAGAAFVTTDEILGKR